jgi:hypothetical protein
MQQRINDKTRIRQKRNSPSNVQIQKQTEESSNAQTHDYNPLGNITCKIGDNACAAKHVSLIQRTELFHPMNESQKAQTLLRLQRQYGNGFVQRVINQHVIQAKMKIGQPGDIYEKEADRVAEQVMQMPEPQLQRQPIEEEEEESPSQTSEVTPNLESRINVNGGEGQLLSASTRAFFEPRCGYDFSQVRVHPNTQAAESVQTVNVRAFTMGRDIVFGAGQYAPETTAGKRLLAHELTHVVQQNGSWVQRQAGNVSVIQRQAAPQAAAPVVPLPQDLVDDIVRTRILHELNRFQNIPIDVTGQVPMAIGFGMTVPVPVTIRVHVQAAYFINTQRARAHYRNRRRLADFQAIKRAIRQSGEISLIESSAGGRLFAGRAVEVGKGTPEDIKTFIDEALRQGVILRYAIRRGVLNRGQQLIDLGRGPLQNLIQQWIRHVGIGVDCSGFALQAAIRAREDVRAAAEFFNQMAAILGLPGRFQVPPEVAHRIRNARSFTGGPRVGAPTDLRPGDAWVVSGGRHIRIVTDVREITNPDGSQLIEFDTAESSGGSTQPLPGPVARTWRTHSRATFDPITRVGGGGGNVVGSFHRIP